MQKTKYGQFERDKKVTARQIVQNAKRLEHFERQQKEGEAAESATFFERDAKGFKKSFSQLKG